MSLILIERIANLNGPIIPDTLNGVLNGSEIDAHKFIITATRDGATVALTGTVTASFLRADGAEVVLTGEIENGAATVTLAQSCYAVPGRFDLTIFVTADGVKTGVYACTGGVRNTTSGTIVDPGQIVPSVDDIIAKQEELAQDVADASSAIASAQNAVSYLAPVFSTSQTYAVGEYVTKDGALYICTTAVETAGAWDAANWQAVTFGGEVTGLKSAFNKKNDNDMIVEALNFESESIPKYISPSTNKWTAAANARGWMFSIPDRCIFLRIKGGTNSTSLAFLKTNVTTNGTTPDYSDGETRRIVNALTEYDLIVPNDAHYVYIQKSTSSSMDLTPNFANKLIEPNIIIIDSTLTEAGKAADSKVVGDKLSKIIPITLPFSSINGSYVKYSNGTTETGENFGYTDYLSVDGINQIIYSRVVVSAQYSPQHGIAFYNSNKEFISGIRSIAKGDKSGYEIYTADVPENAKFVRCTMWNSTFSETNNIDSFYIGNKKDWDRTLTSYINNITNEFSPTAILHAVPQSEGVQNAILTARQFTDIQWTPVADMPGIIHSDSAYVYKTHKKGCRQKGIPYGSGLPYAQMVGDSIAFDAFATAVKNGNSVLYTNSEYSDGKKKASYYGVACSKLVQACWGAPELVDSQQIFNLPGITKIANAGEFTFDDIQLCDGIMNPTVHCAMVTDIIRSAATLEVVGIEISEAVTPTCRRLVWSKGEFDKHFGSYSLYRYSYINDAKYHKARYIDLDDGYDGVNDIPVAIRRGSFINMPKSSAYKADVDNTKWTTLHDIVGGEEQTRQISSSEIAIPNSRTGYHEVYPTDASGNRGNSSFYFVYELSVSGSVSSGSVTVTYSITDGAKPWVLVFDPYNYTFLTEDTGTITAEIPSEMTSCYLLFKSDYGTIKSSTMNLT